LPDEKLASLHNDPGAGGPSRCCEHTATRRRRAGDSGGTRSGASPMINESGLSRLKSVVACTPPKSPRSPFGRRGLTQDEHAQKLLQGVEELHTYVERNQAFIPNYGERYRNGERALRGSSSRRSIKW
jgi:hypothetical protein